MTQTSPLSPTASGRYVVPPPRRSDVVSRTLQRAYGVEEQLPGDLARLLRRLD